MRALILVLAGLLSLTWASQAHAKGKPETPDKAAKRACAAGDYRKGVEILADLYVRTDDTTFIFNQARCYEQCHQWVSAIDRFREFVRKTKDISPEATAEAESHIADCKRYQAEEEAKSASPPVPSLSPVAALPAEVPPSSSATAEANTIITSPPPGEHDAGGAMRATGLVVAGVGVATLAAAVALNLKANQLASDTNKTQSPSTESSQKSYKMGALICYGTGAAALVTGGVLYWLGHAKGGQFAVALLPTWTPGEATITLRGEF
jgi:hypothetical protein